MSEHDVLNSRIVLGDVLDDGILSSRPGDPGFPLRVLFGDLAAKVATDEGALALAGALNLYFRADAEEDAKVTVGLLASRLYYATTEDSKERAKTSVLFAKLLSTEVTRVRYEAVDHVVTFDSEIHEREPGARQHESRITAPRSFLVRVASTNAVRHKARVQT